MIYFTPGTNKSLLDPFRLTGIPNSSQVTANNRDRKKLARRIAALL
jgi:hypothetical protein